MMATRGRRAGEGKVGRMAAGECADIPSVGSEVYGIEGEWIGTVVDVGRDHILVAMGRFSADDRLVPRSAIARIAGRRIALGMTRARLKALTPEGRGEYGGQ